MASAVSALQIPYREPRDGFWGEQTSTLNWCEEDYNVTYYIAEVVNTLTNLVFLYLGVKGLRNVIRHGHPRVFILAFLGYMTVGMGSMAFHTTLWYSMQLADELPMIYTVCILCSNTFSHGKSPRGRILVGAGFFGAAAIITIYYLYAKDAVFHQVAYGLLSAGGTFWGYYLMEAQLRPALKKRNPDGCGRMMRELWAFSLTGLFLFLGGFFIWNMDNIFCRYLVTARNQVLLPWAALLEGHGWWHILTGLAYYLILQRLYLGILLDGKEREFRLQWDSLYSIPQIVPQPARGSRAQSKKTQ
ncbi:alkaline phytoceramidase [Lasiosphaeria miniovina]|uniref:Alkaline phytoceramidase n=1 Tax=Lasiosphaeria miniovina TaxID=1954250 RepID=A0AA40BG36_9PEZI|nr:alkaline phytoceramidase [Lasiosphaeria miniovina]KAK0733605.1 alkaline phytoceramidase [Lasiosphaeria miniovina]